MPVSLQKHAASSSVGSGTFSLDFGKGVLPGGHHKVNISGAWGILLLPDAIVSNPVF